MYSSLSHCLLDILLHYRLGFVLKDYIPIHFTVLAVLIRSKLGNSQIFWLAFGLIDIVVVSASFLFVLNHVTCMQHLVTTAPIPYQNPSLECV